MNQAYYITQQARPYRQAPVQGTAVILDGWLDFDFFSHPEYNGPGISISEAHTGICIGTGPSLQLARQCAIQNLQAMSKQNFRRHISYLLFHFNKYKN